MLAYVPTTGDTTHCHFAPDTNLNQNISGVDPVIPRDTVGRLA